MRASGQCAKEGAAYGNCVLQQYENMTKGACDKEFAQFKNCVSKAMKK